MPLTRADLREAMVHLAKQLDNAPFGARHSIVELACEGFCMSRQTVYRHLASVGWTSGRKPRMDKGASSVPMDTLTFFSAALKTSVRANGKVTSTVPTLMGIAAGNGIDVPASASTIRRQLRQHGLDIRTQSRASSHVQMRSLHPNHVHQVDASLCVLYYLNGKQGLMRDDMFYKNKLEGLAKIKYKVYRWVLTDHASAFTVPWYCEAAGENQLSLAEFLLFAWSQQAPRVFHGPPRILIWDKGAANKSHTVKALLRGLKVEDIAHATGNSRAKGQVECAQNLVEKEFESRLRLQPVASVDELNDAASAWAHAFNGNAIPSQDTRVHRGPMHLSRTDLWRRIKEDELRYLPDVEKCRALLVGREETRKVAGNLQIQFKHPASEVALRYSVAGLDGISNGDELVVQPMLYGDCAIVVSRTAYDGNRLEWEVEPIRDYDAFGFRESAPVFGQNFKANPQTIAEASAKALDRVAYGERSIEDIDKAKRKNEAPFGGSIDAHSHLAKIEQPVSLPKRGSEISIPDRVSVDAAPLSRIAACKALVAMLGRPLSADENRKVGIWYPNGVPEADLPQIALALRTHTTPFGTSVNKEASA
jgi:transposase InsO family protein